MIGVWLAACDHEGSLPPLLPTPTSPTTDETVPAPPALELAVSPLEIGLPTELRVSGAPAGAELTIWRGAFGGTTCSADLGGCAPIGAAVRLVDGVADSAGASVLLWTVDESEGAYPVLVAVADQTTRSLPVMRRVWQSYPTFLEFATFVDDPFEGVVPLVAGVYQDLEWSTGQFRIDLAHGELLTARTHLWRGWGDAFHSAGGSGAQIAELELADAWWVQALASGEATVELGQDLDYWEPQGLYELDLRILPPGSTTPWYIDSDGDGYGGATTAEAALPPAGYAWRPGDCDDAAPTIHPDAFDACGDGADDDCSGADKPCSQALVGDFDVDDVSIAALDASDPVDVRAVSDIDGDQVRDVVLRTPSDVDLLVFPATLGEPVRSTTDATLALRQLGPGVTDLADLDRDGVDDVVLSDSEGGLGGEVYVLSAPLDADLDRAWATLTGTQYDGRLGAVLDVRGDADGDGLPDLIVGGTFLDALWLITEVPPGESALASVARTEIVAGAEGVRGGYAGDIDGDGRTDLFVAEGWAAPLSIAGDLPAGSIAVVDAAVATFAAARGTFAAGDVDGDGRADVVATEVGSRAFVWVGPLSGALGEDSAATVLHWDDELGGRTVLVGDLDGDGIDDLAAQDQDTAQTFVLYGPPPASVWLSTEHDAAIRGSWWLSAVDDYDGDGLDDLFLLAEELVVVRGTALDE